MIETNVKTAPYPRAYQTKRRKVARPAHCLPGDIVRQGESQPSRAGALSAHTPYWDCIYVDST
ncbi:MAG TPA: hypothetical protein VGK58_16775 [Lacipirellulaceae bacterium]